MATSRMAALLWEIKRIMATFDGTRYAGKPARTVWSGGKAGDEIKGLPITISFCSGLLGQKSEERDEVSLFSGV